MSGYVRRESRKVEGVRNLRADVIVLHNEGLKEIPWETIAGRSSSSSSSALDMSCNLLTDIGSFLPIICQLRRVDLSYNSLKSTASFSSLPCLEWLSLAHNLIRVVAVEHLATNKQLLHLDLSYNALQVAPQLTDVLPALESLDMRGNPLKKAVQKLNNKKAHLDAATTCKQTDKLQSLREQEKNQLMNELDEYLENITAAKMTTAVTIPPAKDLLAEDTKTLPSSCTNCLESEGITYSLQQTLEQSYSIIDSLQQALQKSHVDIAFLQEELLKRDEYIQTNSKKVLLEEEKLFFAMQDAFTQQEIQTQLLKNLEAAVKDQSKQFAAKILSASSSSQRSSDQDVFLGMIAKNQAQTLESLLTAQRTATETHTNLLKEIEDKTLPQMKLVKRVNAVCQTEEEEEATTYKRVMAGTTITNVFTSPLCDSSNTLSSAGRTTSSKAFCSGSSLAGTISTAATNFFGSGQAHQYASPESKTRSEMLRSSEKPSHHLYTFSQRWTSSSGKGKDSSNSLKLDDSQQLQYKGKRRNFNELPTTTVAAAAIINVNDFTIEGGPAAAAAAATITAATFGEMKQEEEETVIETRAFLRSSSSPPRERMLVRPFEITEIEAAKAKNRGSCNNSNPGIGKLLLSSYITRASSSSSASSHINNNYALNPPPNATTAPGESSVVPISSSSVRLASSIRSQLKEKIIAVLSIQKPVDRNTSETQPPTPKERQQQQQHPLTERITASTSTVKQQQQLRQSSYFFSSTPAINVGIGVKAEEASLTKRKASHKTLSIVASLSTSNQGRTSIGRSSDKLRPPGSTSSSSSSSATVMVGRSPTSPRMNVPIDTNTLMQQQKKYFSSQKALQSRKESARRQRDVQHSYQIHPSSSSTSISTSRLTALSHSKAF